MRVALLVSLSLMAASARAFCGFYVKTDDERLTSRATRVVLFRDGTTTVMSMQPTYEGPPEDFAMIVPSPSPITADDVRTLEPAVLERVDELTSPRLVEYWENEPECSSDFARGYHGMSLSGVGYGAGTVRIEAQFAVGEYDIVVLSASESSALEGWLRAQGYRVPEGASTALRPYLEQGYRFFAARVNADRVRFRPDGTALLSPLRIRMTSNELVLPVRLGVLSSPGTQDLIVYVVSREGRYEVANRENVLVPTNLVVRSGVRGAFGAFYEALLGRVWERHPGAVITEYAWDATTCDPCPGPTMSAEDITTLGGDLASNAQRQESPSTFAMGPVIHAAGPPLAVRRIATAVRAHSSDLVRCVDGHTQLTATISIRRGRIVAAAIAPELEAGECLESALHGAHVERSSDERTTSVRVAMSIERHVRWVQTSARGFNLTRLRYRYGTGSPADDLVLRRADPIAGGVGEPDHNGVLHAEVRTIVATSTFQARYAILHRYRGPRRCASPFHMGWGQSERPPRAARALTRSRRMPLERAIVGGVPALAIEPRRRRR